LRSAGFFFLGHQHDTLLTPTDWKMIPVSSKQLACNPTPNPVITHQG
jgi:hypothetical protein